MPAKLMSNEMAGAQLLTHLMQSCTLRMPSRTLIADKTVSTAVKLQQLLKGVNSNKLEEEAFTSGWRRN